MTNASPMRPPSGAPQGTARCPRCGRAVAIENACFCQRPARAAVPQAPAATPAAPVVRVSMVADLAPSGAPGERSCLELPLTLVGPADRQTA